MQAHYTAGNSHPNADIHCMHVHEQDDCVTAGAPVLQQQGTSPTSHINPKPTTMHTASVLTKWVWAVHLAVHQLAL
jgi:Cu/Zn superoxide dismutase